MTEVRETSERPAGQREQHQTRDRHQLERHAVGQHHVERHDRQRRDHHVEAVQRKAAVPVHRPARELEVRQEIVTQIRRRPDVGSHVAAGRSRAVEDEVAAGRQRIQVDDHHDDHGGGHEDGRGDEHLDDALRAPGSIPPRDRTAEHAAHEPRPEAGDLDRRSRAARRHAVAGLARRRVDHQRPWLLLRFELAVEPGSEVLAGTSARSPPGRHVGRRVGVMSAVGSAGSRRRRGDRRSTVVPAMTSVQGLDHGDHHGKGRCTGDVTGLAGCRWR